MMDMMVMVMVMMMGPGMYEMVSSVVVMVLQKVVVATKTFSDRSLSCQICTLS